MAKKKLVKKVLDSTQLDEKIIAEYNENKSLYNNILCHCKCYGGYVLAVGAGCLFGVNTLAALSFLLGASIWAYTVRRCKPEGCKKDDCETTKKTCSK
jgi:hypothetical protein|tara:strand:- start:227 stop:520 length:294 start_codon:yes stop_codon:yes gene_type:complete